MFFLLIGPRSELFTLVTPLSVQFLSLHLPVIDIGHPGGRLLSQAKLGRERRMDRLFVGEEKTSIMGG